MSTQERDSEQRSYLSYDTVLVFATNFGLVFLGIFSCFGAERWLCEAVPLVVIALELTASMVKRISEGWYWLKPRPFGIILALSMVVPTPLFFWLAVTKIWELSPPGAVFFVHFPTSFILGCLGGFELRFQSMMGLNPSPFPPRKTGHRDSDSAGANGFGDGPEEKEGGKATAAYPASRAWIWKLLVAQAVFLVGFAGWGAAIACGLGFLQPPRSLQMPPGTIGDIELDRQGRIYLALQMYGRVQVYDNSGRFLYGWQVDTAGGTMKMEIRRGTRVNVVAHRVDRQYVYSLAGELLDEKEVDGDYVRRFGDDTPLEEEGPGGSRYRVRWRTFYPYVTKTSDGKDAVNILSTPFWLWLMMAPFPTFIWALIGIATTLAIVLPRELRKRRKTGP